MPTFSRSGRQVLQRREMNTATLIDDIGKAFQK
jgi:hypothetical protein